MKDKTFKKVIIVGAGPAGISAAIQLNRYGIKPLIIEKNSIGGLLKNAFIVENYPGFPSGVSGIRLVNLFKKHIEKNYIDVLYDEVIDINKNNSNFNIITKSSLYYSDFIIIASGTKENLFKDCEIPSEIKNKIFYESYPLRKCKNKKIIIIGAGDAAFDYGLNLGRNNDVIILNRNSTFKALPILAARMKDCPRINYYKNTIVNGISCVPRGKIELKILSLNKKMNLEVDFVLFAIGRKPDLGFLSAPIMDQLKEPDRENGLQIIGDAKNGMFRQTAIACGDGILAAMKIYKKINGNIR